MVKKEKKDKKEKFMSFNSKDFKGFTFRSGPVKKTTKQNSHFWMNDDDTNVDDFLGIDTDVKKGKDLVALAGYKRAIGNFVKIVSGNDVSVKYNNRDESYTDGKTVTISSKVNGKSFDSTVGLALHEGSHVLLTDFNLLPKLEEYIEIERRRVGANPNSIYSNINKKYDMGSHMRAKSYVKGHIKNLLNIVEDRRIDNFVYNSAPGYRGYYEALYDKYFNSKIVDKGLKSDAYTGMNWESYMFRICNITNPNRRLDIMNFRKIWNILDLKNIDRLKSSQDALDVAFQIFDFVETQLPKPSPEDDPYNENEAPSNECNGEGEGDISSEDVDQMIKDIEDGKVVVDDGSKADGEEAKSSKGKMPDLTPRQMQQLAKAIQKQKDFLNEDVKKKKLSKKDQRSMKAMEESGIELEEVKYKQASYYGKAIDRKQNVYVIKNVTQTLIDSNQFPEMFDNYHYSMDRQKEAIKSGLVLGKMLGKKLKVRAEQRDTKFNRLRTGKIDNRMLASCGYGNESIFEKIESFAYNPGMLHISIDNSGSMNGSRLRQAMKTTMAIAKACSMIENMDVVVSFRSADNVGGAREYLPVIGIIYDSRKDHLSKLVKIMPQVRACGTTPEGLCFAAIMNELVKASKGKDAYFVNMCDGMPWFANYGGEEALNHTKQQVKKMRKEGIKVISYFIGSSHYDSQKEAFQTMYGKDSNFIDTNNLVTLAKTMNNKFLEIA